MRAKASFGRRAKVLDDRAASGQHLLVPGLAVILAQRLLLPLAHRWQVEHMLEPGGAAGAELEGIGPDTEHDRRKKGIRRGELSPGEERAAEPLRSLLENLGDASGVAL